jgi:hypothetical protein
MRPLWVVFIVASFVDLLSANNAFAQQKKPTATVAPAEKLADGWEEIDQRLIFLMVRLANAETSLDAVEKAIGAGTRKRAAKVGEAKRAEAGNDRMDRKGGGPMKWSEFYGTTAEKFFYHPTDRNTTYHTTTILSQQGPQADNKVGGGVPAGQGVPAHQRPPQFDYIYRANENAKERAEEEAAEFKGRVNELIERRQRLEAEQAGLWCEIAFRAVSHYDLDKKPLYRFEPIAGSDTTSRQSAESMRAASSFMALALSIISEAEKDQAATFSKIKPAVAQARLNLNDSWLRLAVDVKDRNSNEGRFAALAKRLDDVASNLSDSYVVAIEGDQAKDQQRKDTFRAKLQESLVNYAQIILALDEMSEQMKGEWTIKPDVDKPIQFVSLDNIKAVRLARPVPTALTDDQRLGELPDATARPVHPTPSDAAEDAKARKPPHDAVKFKGHSYKVVKTVLTWHQAKTKCEEMGGHLATIGNEAENAFVLNLAIKTLGRVGPLDGVWLGATDELQEGQWEWVDGKKPTFAAWNEGQPNNKGNEEHYLILLLNAGAWADQPNESKQHVPYLVCEWDVQPKGDRGANAPASESIRLFDGKSLKGWAATNPTAGGPNWSAKNGVLAYMGVGPSLATQEKFNDFDLHLEFALTEGCNSGVYLRGRYEVQLLDSAATLPNGNPVPPTGVNGAIWGLIAPTQVVYSGPGKWNTLDVRLIGRTVTVRINNVTVIDGQAISRPTIAALDANESEPGPIMLQGHTGVVKFRNITIAPMP